MQREKIVEAVSMGTNRQGDSVTAQNSKNANRLSSFCPLADSP